MDGQDKKIQNINNNNNNHHNNQNHNYNQQSSNNNNINNMNNNNSNNNSSNNSSNNTDGFVHVPNNINNNNNNNINNNNNNKQHCDQKYDPSAESEQIANGNGRDDLKNNDDDSKKVIDCEPFKPHKPKQPGLRANVFVSKDCTRDLAEHVVEEDWGNDKGMLYKYLDYIFRCQIFDGQVKKVTYSKGDPLEIVIFHTGLQRREDHNFLYFVLKANDPEKRNAEQRWRVPAGSISQSCFSKDELMGDKWLLKEEHLPKRTKFYNSLQELLFDESFQIEVNWPERLRTNKERIYQELKNNAKDIDKSKLVSELSEAFAEGLKKAENQAKANPRLAVAQGFVETKHYKKRVELLLPLKIEYPKDSKKYHTFALALRKVDNAKKYTGMSLLTMSMAYANARLVGYVDSSWLTNDTISNKKDKKDKDKDRDRGSSHNDSPQNSQSNSIQKDMKGGFPGMMMRTGHAMKSQRYDSMTFVQNVSRSRGLVARGHSMGVSRSGGYSQMSSGHLPPIPDTEMAGMVSPNQVNMDDGNGYNIATTNMYGNGPNNNHNQMYYQKQQQQQYNQQYQQQQQPPYIDNDQMSDNAPLSVYEQHQQPQRQKYGQSGQSLKITSLNYSKSALPVMAAAQEPELHHPVPTNEEDEEQQNDLEPLINDLDLGLHDDKPPRGDGTGALGFHLGDSEQEIQNLKYGQSEPPMKVSSNKKQFRKSSIRKPYSPISPQNNTNQIQQQQAQTMAKPTMHQQTPQIRQHYVSSNVATLPDKVKKYAQPATQQWGIVPYVVTGCHNSSQPNDNRSVRSATSDSQKFLLQLSRLPGDCGVNTLRQIFTASGSKLQSVHLIDDDKTAVLRFPDKAALNSALEFVSRFKWKSKTIQDSPYLKNYDQQDVWQYQESTKWRAHHPEMGKLIEQIPPRTDLIIEHGQRKYFIEKYNQQQGRQTNLRTRNQRMIRRIRIHVWAPKTNPIREKAIPRIVTQAAPSGIANNHDQYSEYLYGQQQQQYQQQHQQQQGIYRFPPQQKQSIPQQQPVETPKQIYQQTAAVSRQSSSSQQHQQQQHELPLMNQYRGSNEPVVEKGQGLNAEAKEYIPPINTQPSGVIAPQYGINLQHQQHQYQQQPQPKYIRSEPPKNNYEAYNSLTPVQKINPSQASSNNNNNPTTIQMVTKQFKNWTSLAQEQDDADYENLRDACGTNQFSGIWYFCGQKDVMGNSNNLKGYKKETPVYYIPEGDEAESVMENGLISENQFTSFTFFGTVKQALQFVINEAADEQNNVTVFVCEVCVPSNNKQILQGRSINVHDVSKVNFVACAAVNIHILKTHAQ